MPAKIQRKVRPKLRIFGRFTRPLRPEMELLFNFGDQNAL
jgi:hypothetical protein